MGYEARLKAAAERRKREVAGRVAVIVLVIATVFLWGYALIQR